MTKLVMAIDQGTTGSTVLLLDKDLSIKAKINKEFSQKYPQPGWVEHDPEEIWTSVLDAVSEAIQKAGASAEDIVSIGITNQRETTLLWDAATGKPVHNAIVWQCRRTSDLCQKLKDEGHEGEVRARSGLLVDPYFSATKIRWLLDNVPGLRKRADKGEIRFGTIDAFLTWRLTGGQVHVTDVTNASRTALFNIHSLLWDPELLSIFSVPDRILPEVRPSSQVYGTTRGLGVLPDGIPVSGMAGDQQAALFGQACFQPGQSKCTYGTGAFLIMNVGAKPVLSDKGLLATVAWQIADEVSYALEGSVFIAGAAVQWLRDGLGIIRNASEMEALAGSVPDSGSLTFVPALSGLGAPYWEPEARGLICGLTRGATRAHLARATLEGIAFSVHEVLLLMQEEAGRKMESLRVDGGAAANNLLIQLQADLLRAPIMRPSMLETTALGAAFLSGLAVSFWKNTKEISERWQMEKEFVPSMSEERASAMLRRWHDAVARARLGCG